VKSAGARSAGNPHAACDVAGAGNGITEASKSGTKVETPDTDKKIPSDYCASTRPYHGHIRTLTYGLQAIADNGVLKSCMPESAKD